MKRDLDLIRKIMLAIEENTGVFHRDAYMNAFPGVSKLNDAIGETDWATTAIHMAWLVDADYVEVIPYNQPRCVHYDYKIIRLTSSGCDYLDSIRNDGIWHQTKERVKEVGGSVTLDIVKSLAEKIITSQLGI